MGGTGVALPADLFSNRPMVAETEIAGEDHTQGNAPTAFVRDFAGKAYLLFLFHDLGYLFHNNPEGRPFRNKADEIGRAVAQVVRMNTEQQYRPLLRKSFFEAVTAELKNQSEVTHENFLVAIRSDRDDGTCLTNRRKKAVRESDWFSESDEHCLVWHTIGHLLDFKAINIRKTASSGFDTSVAGRVLIKPGQNRAVMRLFSGARLRSSGGIIGTLERTPFSRFGNGYNRDYVIIPSKGEGNGEDYRRGEAFLTQVEINILLRLATVFGFGCNCDETETLFAWESAMKSPGDPMRQAVWQAFAGDSEALPGGDEMRGRSLEEFSAAYFALLGTATDDKLGSLFTDKKVSRRTQAQQETKGPASKTLQDHPAHEQYGETELLVDFPSATPDELDYDLAILGQMNVHLQMIVTRSVGERYYAFGDLRLKLDFTGVQKEFRIARDSWRLTPADMINEGIVKFESPHFTPRYDLRMKLSKVTGLSTHPVFPGDGIPLFRFERAAENARFEGELFVRAGSLECVEGTDDDSARTALRKAVEQFLIIYGKVDATDQTFVPVARKGWRVWRGASDSNK
jgi:hypothetical protein